VGVCVSSCSCSYHSISVSCAFDWSLSCSVHCYISISLDTIKEHHLSVLISVGTIIHFKSSSSSILSRPVRPLSVRYRSPICCPNLVLLLTTYSLSTNGSLVIHLATTNARSARSIHRPFISNHHLESSFLIILILIIHPLPHSPPATRPARYRRPLSLNPAAPSSTLLLLLKTCYNYILLLFTPRYPQNVIHEMLSPKQTRPSSACLVRCVLRVRPPSVRLHVVS
jgi:hypothetical protein